MTENDPGQDPGSVGDQRLTSLDERLQAIQHAEKARTASAHKKPEKGYSQGNRVLTELIAGIVGGSLLGWCFDHWLGTKPWLLLAMLFLGIGVAFRNIIRISQERPE
ncbi:MAG: AtpZ/AtpI family protein [Pseudomonadota bacterium]|uniref:AtpZ/AtpI family protein n=1 Tax=Rhizorhabdus phycosphaerae TaxID=2711156 RepID=UPI0013ECFF16|nr:AtpZ/AtpI family protein [Rhizorhabdus phycosphaerae]